ncbi:hypothetical protein E1301_Tti013452 [Triplophysa tibetana]|uniref:Immunoglobulin domain-containing protein n=1 Tax=Triplophysa tibetana TaxID=1572043 RepID=A0A5A9NR00_9TELE|nr:hypothetical protein E1301_Tti013452 [Triplophysa tibetana]
MSGSNAGSTSFKMEKRKNTLSAKTLSSKTESIQIQRVFVDVTDEKSVSVNEGESVTLHTDVTKLLNDDKIRWRFGEEGSATLIAEMTGGGAINFENDARFKDRLQILDLHTGDLIIKNIRHNHSGRYEVDYENNTGTAYQRLRVTVNAWFEEVCGAVYKDNQEPSEHQ